MSEILPPGDRATIARTFPATRILGVPVSQVNMPRAVEAIVGWCRRKEDRIVCIRDVHGIMRAQSDAELAEIHERADMVAPDGMPLVLLNRLWGGPEGGRVCGPDLVDALCAASAEAGVAHYFYGGKPGVADAMAQRLSARFPGLKVAGTKTPPFGDMSEEDDRAATAEIAQTSPGVVWVGLGTPRQEYWMRDHVGRIPGATLIGVGAAFDFHAGEVDRAPKWMQRSGLEWLHRLASEPRRLWRRYLLLAPLFIYRVVRQGRPRPS